MAALNQVGWAAAALCAAIPAGWAAARVAAIWRGAAPSPSPAISIAATAGVFGWAAATTPAGPALAFGLMLGWTLLVLAVIDAIVLRLPDALTLPLAAAGLVAALALPGEPIADHAIGALAGYAVLAVLAWAFERLSGREGLGLGDAKLLGAAGAWLGWRPLPSAIILACVLAFAWVAVRAVARGRASVRQKIAFGVPLCLAIWIVWLHGPLDV